MILQNTKCWALYINWNYKSFVQKRYRCAKQSVFFPVFPLFSTNLQCCCHGFILCKPVHSLDLSLSMYESVHLNQENTFKHKQHWIKMNWRAPVLLKSKYILKNSDICGCIKVRLLTQSYQRKCLKGDNSKNSWM